MSNGTTNYPTRLAHPSAPAAGRVIKYIFDDGAGAVEPYFMLDDGIPRNLKGTDGTMNVDAFVSEPALVTLPNVTVPNLVYANLVTIKSLGPCFLDVSLTVMPHAAGNDMLFELHLDGIVLQPTYVEEHKDASAAQSNWRSVTIDLGILTATTKNLELFFSKESAGGTAQLINYVAKLVRY